MKECSEGRLLGGLGGMRDWKAWRGTGIGEAGRGRTQQISSKHWSKAIENLLIFYQNFDAFGSKILKNLSWKASGGSKSQKMLPNQVLHQKLRIGQSQDYPKEAESCPQIDPREAKGKLTSPFTVILRGKSIQNR